MFTIAVLHPILLICVNFALIDVSFICVDSIYVDINVIVFIFVFNC